MSAYLKRDWLVWSSYRFAAVFQLAAVAGVIIGIAFAGDVIVQKASIFEGSRNYASFALAGLAFTDALFSGLTGPAQAVRAGQVSGTLEPTFLTPIRAWQFVVGSSVFQVVLAFVRTGVFIIAAVVFLGYWHNADVPAAVLVFIPAFLTFLGLGLLASAFTVVVKQGEPVVAGYLALSGLLGGTLFPVRLLPSWMRTISQFLPLTHALQGLRLALSGHGVLAIGSSFAPLAVLAALLVPTGLLAVTKATQRARREGSLVVY
ncbi:MAG TPA: ABC transporter permease [Acidimicrobiales bacterium]